MKIELNPAIDTGEGSILTYVEISAIVPTDYGAMIQFTSGATVRVGNQDTPEDFPVDARIQKAITDITLGDLISCVPSALASRYAP